MYYPGDNYVDINGIDVYTNQVNKDDLYKETLDRKKLFAVTEFGFGIDSLRDNSITSYDFNKLLLSVKSNVPNSVYVLMWSDAWRIGNPNHTHQTELMNDSELMSKDEIDFKFDKWQSNK